MEAYDYMTCISKSSARGKIKCLSVSYSAALWKQNHATGTIDLQVRAMQEMKNVLKCRSREIVDIGCLATIELFPELQSIIGGIALFQIRLMPNIIKTSLN